MFLFLASENYASWEHGNLHADTWHDTKVILCWLKGSKPKQTLIKYTQKTLQLME